MRQVKRLEAILRQLQEWRVDMDNEARAERGLPPRMGRYASRRIWESISTRWIRKTLRLRESAVRGEFVADIRRDADNKDNMESDLWGVIKQALLAMPEVAQVHERWENMTPIVLIDWPAEEDD